MSVFQLTSRIIYKVNLQLLIVFAAIPTLITAEKDFNELFLNLPFIFMCCHNTISDFKELIFLEQKENVSKRFRYVSLAKKFIFN